MHNNLIKVNEMLAFAKNNEGVISLISKKGKDYSFEDIIIKEQEIDELNKEANDLNTEKDKIASDNNFLKENFSIEVFFAIVGSAVIISCGVYPFGISGVTLLETALYVLMYGGLIAYGVFHIKQVIKNYKTIKKNNKDVKDMEEAIEKIKDLINSKKDELENMLDKVDFREYSNKDEIESIISNMFNVTPSKEYSNTLNKDVSNTTTLDGPTLNRRKDV